MNLRYTVIEKPNFCAFFMYGTNLFSFISPSMQFGPILPVVDTFYIFYFPFKRFSRNAYIFEAPFTEEPTKLQASNFLVCNFLDLSLKALNCISLKFFLLAISPNSPSLYSTLPQQTLDKCSKKVKNNLIYTPIFIIL